MELAEEENPIKMKKLLIAVPIISSMLFASCEKESDDRPACEKNNTGTLEFINSTEDSYELYLNNEYITLLLPNNKYSIDRTAGFYQVKFIQSDGYLVIPTENEGTGTLIQCEELTFVN